MNFDFSDDQKQLRDEARKYLGEHSSPKAVREVLDGKAPYDKELWKGLAEMGFLGVAIPESYGGAGAGQHVSGVYFQKVTGTSFQFVPYRAGSSDIMRDLVAGHIDLTFDQAISALPYVRNGQVRAYAITGKTRLASAPDIPTVDEAGAPGVYISTWFGLWAPKGTPGDIVARLTAAAMEAIADPAVAKRLADLGQEIPPSEQQTAAALAAHLKAEIEKWFPIIRGANIKVE